MQRALILLGLVGLACAGICAAEDANGGRLIWNTGESLAGSLKGATPKDIVWDSPWFGEPLVIDSGVLQDVSYKRPLAESQEAFRVQLADGGCFYGDLLGLDANQVRLQSSRHGELKIRRQEVLNIQRIKSGPLRYAGPSSMAGWTVVAGAADLDHWAQAPGAALTLPLWGEMVYLKLPMPDRVEAEFRLSSTDRMNFEVALAAGKPAADVLRIEVWDDQLVAVLKDDFVSLTPVPSSSRDLAFRVLVDKAQNRIVVTDLGGKLWADWKPPTVIGKPSGVWLHNRGKDLTLQGLRVMDWEGEKPRVIEVDQPRIETLGGACYYGQPIASPDGMGLMTQDEAGEPLILPWSTISRVIFATGAKSAAPQVVDKNAKAASTEPAEAWFTDGALIRGAIVEVKEGRIYQKTSFSDEPVSSDLGKLLHLQLHAPIQDNLGKVALGSMDWLVLDKMALHGTLSGGDGSAIEWCVNGGRNPVRVNAKGKVSITRAISNKQTWTPASALFYLSSGDVLPARWHDMDGHSVSFDSELTSLTTLDCAHVKAVHFTQSELQTSGFSDPGWRILKGGDKLVERQADQVKITPGGSFGHASMLVGDEMGFTLHADQGFATLKVRLYCPADGSDAGLINFVVAHFGNNIYYGLEDEGGNGIGRGRQQLAVQSGSSAKVKFVFSDKQIEMRINDVSLHRFPIAMSKRLGCGVVFEPSSLWGNQEQPVRLTGFSVHISPGKSVLPPVRGDAKDQALTVPRFQKDDPPRNVLIASTGDLLRGDIEAATKTHFAFRSGLENIEVPKDRVAAAIWLTRPQPAKSKSVGSVAESDAASVKPTHWLSLMNGGLIAMKVEKIEGGQLTGKSTLLGDCHVPLSLVYKMNTVAPEREPSAQYFDDWSLRYAPEPVLPTSAGQSSPMLGKVPHNFALPLLGGGNFALSDQAGKVVVLDFWATWCGPCVKSLPGLMKTLAEVQSDKVVFVGVNQGESTNDVSQFLETHQWKLKTAMDTEQKVATQFGVEGIPHTVIIGKDGKVAWTRTGYVENGEKEVAELIQKLLKE